MKKVLVGKKETFAIESEITKSQPYLMGHLCLWVNGIQIGALKDEVMLLTVKSGLDTMVKSLIDQRNHEFLKMTDEALFSLIFLDEDFENGKYLTGLPESFDDFILFTFTSDKEIHFVWKLRDDPFFSYPKYPKGILHKKVSISEFIRVVESKKLWLTFKCQNNGGNP